MIQVHWLDIVVLAVLVLNVLVGVARGAIRELFSLTAVASGLFLAYRFHPLLASSLSGVAPMLAKVGSFALIFIVVFFGVSWLGVFLSTALKGTGMKSADRWAGALFGALRGLLMIALLLWGLGVLMPQGARMIQQSTLGPVGVAWTQTAVAFYHDTTGRATTP